jgi:hypothetical protein
VLVPVIHYFCLCPKGDHQQECTCMCRKCTARKARTGSSQCIEYFRLNIEYLRYSIDFKKDGAKRHQ